MKVASVKNVSFAYNQDTEDEVLAVDNISFDIFENDFIALCGHNGSGKSTVAKLLNGLYEPKSGDVEVFGLNTREDKNLFDIRRSCGVVFQNPDNQMVASIIEDDIAFGAENIGLKQEEIVERVNWALDAVGMSAHRKGTPFRLSGGQKQRIAIAGVLAIKPRILILDEATSMLDPLGRQEVLSVVQKLYQEQKITVIMITHFMEEAALANRVIIMNKGKIAADGGKEVLYRQEMLNELKLESPLPVRLANALRAHNLPLKEDIFSIDELALDLLKIKNQRGAK